MVKKFLAAVITLSMTLSFAAMPAHAAALSSANKTRVTDVSLRANTNYGTSKGKVTITTYDENSDGVDDYVKVYNDKNITGGAISKSSNTDIIYYAANTSTTPKYVHSRIYARSTGSGAAQNAPIATVRYNSGGSSAVMFNLAEGSSGISCADSDTRTSWRTASTVDWNNGSASNKFDFIFDINGSIPGMVYMFINDEFIGWYYDSSSGHEHTEFCGYSFRFGKDKSFSSSGEFRAWFDTDFLGHVEYQDTEDYTVTLEDVINDAGLADSNADSSVIMTSSDVARYMPNSSKVMNYRSTGQVNSGVSYSGGVTTVSESGISEDTLLADMLKGFYHLNYSGVGGKYLKLSFDQEIKQGSKVAYRLGGASYPSNNSIQFFESSDGKLVSGIQGASDHSSVGNKTHKNIAFNDKVHIDWIIDLQANVGSYVDDYLYINGEYSQTGRVYKSDLLRSIGVYGNGGSGGDFEVEISDWSMTVYNSNATSPNAIMGIIDLFDEPLEDVYDADGDTVEIPAGKVLDLGDGLNFTNGYVNTADSYIQAGDKKITGSNIYFGNDGKIRLADGETAKSEIENEDGETTTQGFLFGKQNPTGIVTLTFEVSGEYNDEDYTGRTFEKQFDFSDFEIGGLANFSFTVLNVPKPLSISVQSN